MTAVDFVKTTNCIILAEIGVGAGETSEKFARHLQGSGMLHLFDYVEKVNAIRERLWRLGFNNVVAHGNSHRLLDDYNWSLMKLLQVNSQPIFDYVYLDGAHSWLNDACAFLLVDRLLKIGGFIEFDDYGWSYATSPTVNPRVCSRTRELYSDEQIRSSQVALVVDLLVKRDRRYRSVYRNRIYEKVA